MVSSNFSDHKINEPAERCLLISYLLIVLLSSLIGDTIILIASVRYNAIKLNKFIVAVMIHIAISDLIRSIVFVSPTIVALISNSRILEGSTGYVIYFLDVCSYSSGNIFIAFLTTSKIAKMKFPLRTRGWTERGAHVICTSVWLSVIIFYGLLFIFCPTVLFFSYIEYIVVVFWQSSFIIKVLNWFYVVSSIIPTFIVILAAAAILLHLLKARKVSRRTGGTVRWRGMAAVSATAIVFSVSAIPVTISFLASTSRSSVCKGILCEVAFVRTSYFIAALNIMCNIYIYWFTVPSFRQFIKLKASELSEYMIQHLPCLGVRPRDTRPREIELRPVDETQSINVL